MLKWLIIGGGIHGTHLSLTLTHRYRVSPDYIRVIDPHEMPLARWHHVTNNVGMEYMRSPHVHNLHWDQGALGVYSRIHQNESYTRFIPPFSRPTLELFNRHSHYLIKKYGLHILRVQATATDLQQLQNGWRVETEHGGIEAERLILAPGMTETLRIPQWALELRTQGAKIHHIFEPDFQRTALPPLKHVAVVGGGISAAQLALSFMPETRVSLMMRHELRIHDFDSDPGWMNRIYLADFAKLPTPSHRRIAIDTARHRGSMPQDVARELRGALENGYITRYPPAIKSAHTNSDKTIQLALSNSDTIQVDAVLLATGYEKTTEERLALGIKDNLVRFAVGIEDTDDLLDDLDQALAII